MTTPDPRADDTVDERGETASASQAPVLSGSTPALPDDGQDDDGRDEQERTGLPAGQLALGAVALLGIGGVLVYEFLGEVWLLAGVGATGYGAVAYVRRGRHDGHRRTSAGGWATTGTRGRTARTPSAGAGGVFGGASTGRRRGGGVGAGGGGRSAFGGRGGGRAGRAAAGRGPGSGMGMTGTGGGRAGRRGTSRSGQAGAGRGGILTGGPTGRAGRRAAGHPGQPGQAATRPAGRVRRAGRAADALVTGGRVGPGLGRAGRWADARAGHRFSRAWHAARGTTPAATATTGTRTGGGNAQAARPRSGWRRTATYAGRTARVIDVLATGGLVGRGFGRAGRRIARTYRWADARAGHRFSRAWHAARGTTPAAKAAGGTGGAQDSGREQTDTTWDGQGQPGPDRRRRQQRPDQHDTTYRRRNRTMSGFPLAAVAAEMNAAAAAHAPMDMFQVARELDQLREVPIGVGMALRTYTQRLQAEYPINPAVVDRVFELYKLVAELVPVAEEIAVLFRQVHAKDLEREEAPRTNEHAWNV